MDLALLINIAEAHHLTYCIRKYYSVCHGILTFRQKMFVQYARFYLPSVYREFYIFPWVGRRNENNYSHEIFITFVFSQILVKNMILDWNKQDIGLYATLVPRKVDCSLGLFTLPGFLDSLRIIMQTFMENRNE